jgi:hypothetical protein
MKGREERWVETRILVHFFCRKHEMNPNKSKYLAKKISALYGLGICFTGSLSALLYL